ncbi:MAG: hypothetical protein AAFU78_03020 [Cyanobacteria bacterium J06633_2]
MEIALAIAAVIISFLIFTWLVQTVKATLSTAFTIAVIVLIIQLIFGIGPQDLLQMLSDFWNQLQQAITG